ncbi:MAG: hypothetical protein M1819_005850 [Sarea resinae]|nr:MAG: hypothetical protein M1819_005850 [Sarea resinae]
MALSSAELLHHVALNESQPETIVLLHGLMGCTLEWAHVEPHLSDYHLLIPDMPSHSGSRHQGPFTLVHAANKVADLIRARAHNSTSHVVGFSAGGYVACTLAKMHPELVSCLFVSGVYNMATRWGWMPVAPLELFMPASTVDYGQRRMGWKSPEGYQKEAAANYSPKMAQEAWKSFASFGDGEPLSMRALAVSGRKQDDTEAVGRLSEVLRKGNPESRAVVVPGAMHPWLLQFPELFAQGIKAWVQGGELPTDFEIIKSKEAKN